MQAEQEILDKALEHARIAQKAVLCLAPRVEGREAALVTIADDSTVAVIARLRELGAQEKEPDCSYALDIPLDAIVPDELEPLLQTLLAARALADRVDTKRRRVDAHGEGCDLGEQVRQLLARVELDLFGPTKRSSRPVGRE